MENTESSQEKEPKGKIVTFYSYKGGVGRSMALANVAVLLAKMGKKVLIVDFDLEAPGLEFFFRNQAILPSDDNSGVVGMLVEMLNSGIGKRIPIDQGFSQRFESKIVCSQGIEVSLIHSGSDTDSYAGFINKFSWRSFFENAHGAEQIELLRNDWRIRYDFILIDSRTGITDIGGVCTVQLPDYLVLVFVANDQNLDGCKRVVEGIHKQRAAFAYDRERLMVIPALSRIDSRAKRELSELWQQKIASVIQPILDDWLPQEVTALSFVDRTKLPYVPTYAFGEKLACLEEREADPDSLTYYYSAIARLIAGHLKKPERLLSLTRRFGEDEIAGIFKRALELETNRGTIAQMEKLIATFTGAAAAQAQPLRDQIKKLAIHDPDLRQDLEAVVFDAEDDSDRHAAISHLKNLPGWTDKDTENLTREFQLYRGARSNFDQAVETEKAIELERREYIIS